MAGAACSGVALPPRDADATAVRGVVTSYTRGLGTSDGAAVCQQLTPRMQHQYGATLAACAHAVLRPLASGVDSY
jgi:hypothetical protein